MPKFLKVDSYQPEDYTKADFMLYSYLKDRANGQRDFTSVSQSIPSVKSSPNLFRQSLFECHISELESCRTNANDQKLTSHIGSIRVLWYENKFDALLELLQKNDEFGPIFKVKSAAFAVAVTLARNDVSGEDKRDPDEFSPKCKSLINLNGAFEASLHSGVSSDVASAHDANKNFLNDPKFEQYCKNEFLNNGPIFAVALPPPSQKFPLENAGFFLKVYRSPAFQHWLTQLLLLAVVLTAALVIMAFTVNATLLPLAVAGVVKGFSGMAAKTILGSAIVIGTGFAVALSASFPARFFLARGDETSVPPAVGKMNPVNK